MIPSRPANSRRLQVMPDHTDRFNLQGKRALVTGACVVATAPTAGDVRVWPRRPR